MSNQCFRCEHDDAAVVILDIALVLMEKAGAGCSAWWGVGELAGGKIKSPLFPFLPIAD